MNIKRSSWKIVPVILFLGVFIRFLILSPQGFQEKLWWLGSAVCHQLPGHSFHLNGLQFPLCARCTGSFLSAFIAMLFFLVRGKKPAMPPKGIIACFTIFFFFWVVDGINSFSSEILHQQLLYPPTNILRFLSGIGMGMVFALIIMTIFNMVIWKDQQETALLQDWKQLGVLLLCESTLVLFPFLRNTFLFQLAGFFSIATVVILIAVLYTILFVVFTHKEATYVRFKELIFPLLVGFSAALLQMLLIGNMHKSFFPFSNFPL
ncbi:MAG TPA: hypothetical protein DCK95_12325 [Anaerolineaceae bacterium]|uniref:DUF2085 domain-containing protein n=1 Tax=Anaerolinea thermophila TaxID=167964 RepID=A0A117LGL9_9CHLR|nr:MAG: hypothetical protein XD73_1005 [Anaerolinea thermophila]HAF63091.1 hypothetical protein [Anaerolineaceae bacterium]